MGYFPKTTRSKVLYAGALGAATVSLLVMEFHL